MKSKKIKEVVLSTAILATIATFLGLFNVFPGASRFLKFGPSIISLTAFILTIVSLAMTKSLLKDQPKIKASRAAWLAFFLINILGTIAYTAITIALRFEHLSINIQIVTAVYIILVFVSGIAEFISMWVTYAKIEIVKEEQPMQMTNQNQNQQPNIPMY